MATAMTARPCICGDAAVRQDPTHEFLLECHYCGTWYHGDCVHINEVDAMAILRFACPPCAKNGHETLTYTSPSALDDLHAPHDAYAPLPIQRRLEHQHQHQPHPHHHHQQQRDGDEGPTAADGVYGFASYRKNTDAFRRTLRAAVFARAGVRVVAPQAFTATYFRLHALDEPVLVPADPGTRLPMVGLQDISALLAANACAVRALDVGTQKAYTLSAPGWAQRLQNPRAEDPIVAQFRILETAFRHEIAAPAAVAEIDWHATLLRATGAPPGANPELHGTLCGAGAFLDFTVAPHGASTWLAVANGDLAVFLVEPTPDNLVAFRNWATSATTDDPATVFLADYVDRCIRCDVKQGATLVIPSGYMVAIYAEHGASFFSGFFGCALTLAAQLRAVMALDSEPTLARLWHARSFPHGWAQFPSPLITPTPPFNAQLWALVCHYINDLTANNSEDVGGRGMPRVGTLEHEGLGGALGLLRRWSRSAPALERLDQVSWLPTTPQDAENLVSQLERALGPIATADVHSTFDDATVNASAAYDRTTGAYETASYLFPSSSTSSASTAAVVVALSESVWDPPGHHPYATTSAFPVSSATSTSSSTSTSLWDYSPYGTHQHDPLDSSASYYQLADPNQFTDAGLPGGYHHHHVSPGYGPGGGFLDGGSNVRPALGPSSPPQHLLGQQLGAMPPLPDAPGGADLALLDNSVRHRASCHRCGNLRKNNVRCPTCPHIFCQKCAEKMVEEHGDAIFVEGCPVCKELCCCGKNRTMLCTRKYHCYKKCPSTKRPSS